MTNSQKDFCSGVGLLYLGPLGVPDQYVHRLCDALWADDVDEAEHVAALMLVILYRRGTNICELSERFLTEFKKK